MSAERKPILIIGELEEDASGDVIIRGYITKDAVLLLQTGPYQRSANFSPAKTKRMVRVIEGGGIRRFPDIILGMRGHNWGTVARGIVLRDSVFIVDGVQRTFAWKLASDDNPAKAFWLGCKVYINTTQESETAMFRELNLGHTPVAPSVILRNEKEVSRVAAMLFGLSHQEGFAVKDRVSWDQVMSKSISGDLVRGSTLLRVLLQLHAHKFIGGREGGSRSVSAGASVLNELAYADAQVDSVGLMRARQNLEHFFDVIDEAWGVRNFVGSKPPVHLRWGWLDTLAKILSDHVDFWRDSDVELRIAASFIKDLRGKVFPSELAGQLGSKTERDVLYQVIVQRLNKGRITNRLHARRERERAEDAEGDGDRPGSTP